MSLGRDSFDASVREFGRATASPSDGHATRARVLAAVGRRARRRVVWRRICLGAAAVLVAALSGSAAWTAIGRWRGTASPAAVEAPRHLPAATAPSRTAPTDGPAVAAAPAANDRTDDGEERAYRRAHEAHFRDDDPRAALSAWNAYLREYPRGAFGPEARYNRALCLVRLGRREAALEALRPLARGAFGAYRMKEATSLIGSLGVRSW
jgi:TolA-binding protein